MSKEMDRRDFLKTATVTGTAFLAADVLQKGGFTQGLVPKAEAAEVSGRKMRTITIEEHFVTPDFVKLTGAQATPMGAKLSDLGERRIADMDAAGIDVQVLSLNAPGVQQTRRDRGSEKGPRYKRHPRRRSATLSDAPRRVRQLAHHVSGSCRRGIGAHGQ